MRPLAVSFLAAAFLTPLLRNFSRGAGWLDRPDGKRKKHPVAVPPSGGWAIFLAVILGSLLLPPSSVVLLPAAGIVFLSGLADDRFGLRPWQKILPQVLAAAMVAGASGFRAGSVVVVLWLVACANSFNLLDGLDGLAAATGIIAAAAMLLARPAAAPIVLPLSGALAGFLIFNLPPASVYLGDSGSLTTGFLLGCAALPANSLADLLAPVAILALPLTDTAFAVIRRLAFRRPLFEGDDGHLHHRVLARARTPVRALLLLTAVCFCAAIAGMAVHTWLAGAAVE